MCSMVGRYGGAPCWSTQWPVSTRRPSRRASAATSLPTADVVFQASTTDAFTLGEVIARVAPEGLERTLLTALEAVYEGVDPATCISLGDRPARLATLRQRLFQLECDEERVICEAARADVRLDRRCDADPAAVLSTVLADDAA